MNVTLLPLPKRRARRALPLLILLAASACNSPRSEPVARGDGSSPDGSAPSAGSPTGQPPSAGPSGGAPDEPGRAAFRRLSAAEYNNTVRDLLGDQSLPAARLGFDQESARSGFSGGGPVSEDEARALIEVTDSLAGSAVQRLPALLPCGAVPPARPEQERCARQFIEGFGKRAFRRPLAPDESQAFADLFGQRLDAGDDFPGAIKVLVSAFLLSPRFLYRWEATPATVLVEGGLVRYNSYEMASRLSYLIWASMPDDRALALADQQGLATGPAIEAEARRMLADRKAAGGIADFFVQWLGLNDLPRSTKDPTLGFSAQLARSMVDETARFASDLVLDGDGTLAALFQSTSSSADAALAPLYGSAPATAGPVALDATQRAGLFTRAGFLARYADESESRPFERGRRIADRALCVPLAPGPPEMPALAPLIAGVSNRQRYAEHSKNPCTAGCHALMDPLGFAFENYDAVGRYRRTDNGVAVDATGTATLDGVARDFKNALELSTLLAGSRQVSECLARQWLRYALRRVEGPGDAASLAAAADSFARSSAKIPELIVAIARTRSFSRRTPSSGEALP
jgi:hypothetical protein